jgi:hypothetical protein
MAGTLSEVQREEACLFPHESVPTWVRARGRRDLVISRVELREICFFATGLRRCIHVRLRCGS